MDEILKEAVAVLRRGGVILYPTDTVWGLGCDACNPEAVARIFSIKQRDDSKALVLLAGNLDMVARYVREIPEIALQLTQVNDKPMTIIYPGAIAGERPESIEREAAKEGKSSAVSPEAAGRVAAKEGKSSEFRSVAAERVAAKGGQDNEVRPWLLAWNVVAADGSVGIRIPQGGFCLELVRRFGRPLVSTSANISQAPTPRDFGDIRREIFSEVDYVVDHTLERGATGIASSIIKVGLDSTIEIIRK